MLHDIIKHRKFSWKERYLRRSRASIINILAKFIKELSLKRAFDGYGHRFGGFEIFNGFDGFSGFSGFVRFDGFSEFDGFLKRVLLLLLLLLLVAFSCLTED